jgi:hypothetical protein
MSSGLLSPGFPSPKRATDVGGRPKMSPTLALIVKKFSDGSGRRVKVAAAAAAAAAAGEGGLTKATAQAQASFADAPTGRNMVLFFLFTLKYIMMTD